MNRHWLDIIKSSSKTRIRFEQLPPLASPLTTDHPEANPPNPLPGIQDPLQSKSQLTAVWPSPTAPLHWVSWVLIPVSRHTQDCPSPTAAFSAFRAFAPLRVAASALTVLVFSFSVGKIVSQASELRLNPHLVYSVPLTHPPHTHLLKQN